MQAAPGGNPDNGVLSVAKAEVRLPFLLPFLPRSVLASHVARYLGCTLEEADRRITNKEKAGWIQTCGLTLEGRLASPADEIVSRVLRPDDVIWPDLRPGLLAKRWWQLTTRGAFAELTRSRTPCCA
jgi:hypothetical protein